MRTFHAVIMAFALASGTGFTLFSAYPIQAEPLVTVYKTPTCGCCGKWVEHLRENGFEVETHDLNDVTPIKIQAGLKPELASCHTAKVGDYYLEGHVPAADIKRLLEEKPDARGLTVPGMPMGSPGMEGAYRDSYDTLLYREGGQTSVFQHHPGDR